MAAQSRNPVILLTRPEEQSARFAEALREAIPMADVVISPLITPALILPEFPQRDWQGVIFSSETAVISARRIVADGKILPRRAFCVGRQTAETAAEAGFDAVSANGNGEDLIELIRREITDGPLLYLRGSKARVDVAKRLSEGGVETVSAIVYEQIEQPLNDSAILALRRAMTVVAPVFSTRSGELLLREIKRVQTNCTLEVVAISAAAGSAFPAEIVTIARSPDGPSMVQAVASRLALLAPS